MRAEQDKNQETIFIYPNASGKDIALAENDELLLLADTTDNPGKGILLLGLNPNDPTQIHRKSIATEFSYQNFALCPDAPINYDQVAMVATTEMSESNPDSLGETRDMVTLLLTRLDDF